MRLLLVLLCSCSWVFTEGPKPETADQPCNASEASPFVDAAFAVVYGITAFVFVADMDSSGDNSDQVKGAVVSGLSAGLLGLSARSGLINVRACRRHNNELYEQQKAEAAAAAAPRVSPSRRDAWQLTKQAAIAARNGDCATVMALEQVVLGLDTEFHGAVFMRDAAIVHCMQTTEVPVQPPGETPPAPAPVTPPLVPTP